MGTSITGALTAEQMQQEAAKQQSMSNPVGSTITQGSGGITVATESVAGGAGNTGANTAYVSQNTNAGVNESLTSSVLNVKNITGGAGADTLTGDAQANWIAGGLGADKLYGGAGDDVLLIDATDTVVDGGAGMDIAQVVGGQLGSAGVTLNLNTSNIEIAVGGDGNDVLIGGGRSSVLIRGGAGDDVMNNGWGLTPSVMNRLPPMQIELSRGKLTGEQRLSKSKLASRSGRKLRLHMWHSSVNQAVVGR